MKTTIINEPLMTAKMFVSLCIVLAVASVLFYAKWRLKLIYRNANASPTVDYDYVKKEFMHLYYMTLFATLMHECAHWVAAKVTFGQPGDIKFKPDFMNGDLAQTDAHHIHMANGPFFALGPLMLLPLALGLFVSDWMADAGVLGTIIGSIVIGNMIYGAMPSKHDWALFRETWKGPFIFAGAFVFALFKIWFGVWLFWRFWKWVLCTSSGNQMFASCHQGIIDAFLSFLPFIN